MVHKYIDMNQFIFVASIFYFAHFFPCNLLQILIGLLYYYYFFCISPFKKGLRVIRKKKKVLMFTLTIAM